MSAPLYGSYTIPVSLAGRVAHLYLPLPWTAADLNAVEAYLRVLRDTLAAEPPPADANTVDPSREAPHE